MPKNARVRAEDVLDLSNELLEELNSTAKLDPRYISTKVEGLVDLTTAFLNQDGLTVEYLYSLGQLHSAISRNLSRRSRKSKEIMMAETKIKEVGKSTESRRAALKQAMRRNTTIQGYDNLHGNLPWSLRLDEPLDKFTRNWERKLPDLVKKQFPGGSITMYSLATGDGPHEMWLAKELGKSGIYVKILAVDFSEPAVKHMLERARTEGLDVSGVVADITKLPIRGRYEIVSSYGAFGVIEGLDNPAWQDNKIKEMKEHTKINGFNIISFVADRSEDAYRIIDRYRSDKDWELIDHKRLYTLTSTKRPFGYLIARRIA